MPRCFFLESATAFSPQVTSRPPTAIISSSSLRRPADLRSPPLSSQRRDSGIFLVVVRSSSLVDAPTPLTTDVWIIRLMIRYQEIVPLNRQCTREFRAVNSYFHETVVSDVFAFKYRDFIVQTWFSLHLFFTNYLNNNLELKK